MGFEPAMASTQITLKRVYEPAAAGDGVRILVERLWPRGLSKDAAALDYWMKDVAPSPSLRVWFGHRPERWAEFQNSYRQELQDNQVGVNSLMKICSGRHVTLVFAAKDERRNSAFVLKEFLEYIR